MSKKDRKELFVIKICKFLFILIGLLSAMGWLSRFGWLFEIFANFRVQYSIILAFLIIPLIIKKKWLWSGVILVFLVINIFEFIPTYFTNKKNIKTKTKIKIMMINIYAKNMEYEKVANFIEKQNPDIIITQEINLHMIDNLEKQIKPYKYQKLVIKDNGFSIGIFSKFETKFKTPKKYYKDKVAAILIGEMKINRKNVLIYAIHLKSPTTPERFKIRNNTLSMIKKDVNNIENSYVILLGDFNMTPYSYYFKKFEKEINLRDSRKGFGIQATWPTFFPILRIPIDHCFASENIEIIDRIIGDSIGSDHFPVILTIGIE